MSTIILFPLSRTAAGRHLSARLQTRSPRQKARDDPPPGPRVVILPVVRIERHGMPAQGRTGDGRIGNGQTGDGECAIISGYFDMPPEGPHPA